MSHTETSGPALVVRHTGQVFSLGTGPVFIGRQAGNSIVLSDPQVSGRHAAVTWQGDAYVVQDLGSTAGTYVNERRITVPKPLRDGYVLRVGNTLFDVSLPPPEILAEPEVTDSSEASSASTSGRRPAFPVIMGALLGGFLVVCLVTAAILFLLDQRGGKPAVAILSPEREAKLLVGKEIVLQASATGAQNITSLELTVDGVTVAVVSSTDEAGQASLMVTQRWTFVQAGDHTITAVASTAQGRRSAPASLQVAVAGEVGELTPGPGTATPPVTASPSASPVTTATPTPTVTPEPTATGLPVPVIEFFRANPDTIDRGACTTLEWGKVSFATEAVVDNGIGGIGTPGNHQVCPTETTTYVMTATGLGGSVSASATVTVKAELADLTVVSVAFVPAPPVRGQDAEVRITLRNLGSGPAGAFDWSWQPGSAAPLTGSVGGLAAGETIVVAVPWRPESASDSLQTVAQVDTGNAVVESDETNNQLAVSVQVVEPGPRTVDLISQPDLDGYVVGGQGANNANDIRVGDVSSDSGNELEYRGFLSFDLSQIPTNANIQQVRLSFFQAAVEGGPYAKLGQLVLSHVDYGDSLDTADFNGPVLASQVLPGLTAPGTWYAIDGQYLANWITQDLAAGRSRFQVRLQFSSPGDGDTIDDYVRIESGDNSQGTGNLPQLAITYNP